MSTRNIAQPLTWSIDKFIQKLMNHFDLDTSKWVNGRPVLLNCDVWCPLCTRWHANNSLCQHSN